jgi:hypothetical protein
MQELGSCLLQDPDSLLGQFTVAKRIALYLARVSPQHTIDHLVSETALLLHEEDDAPLTKAGDKAGKVWHQGTNAMAKSVMMQCMKKRLDIWQC